MLVPGTYVPSICWSFLGECVGATTKEALLLCGWIRISDLVCQRGDNDARWAGELNEFVRWRIKIRVLSNAKSLAFCRELCSVYPEVEAMWVTRTIRFPFKIYKHCRFAKLILTRGDATTTSPCLLYQKYRVRQPWITTTGAAEEQELDGWMTRRHGGGGGGRTFILDARQTGGITTLEGWHATAVG